VWNQWGGGVFKGKIHAKKAYESNKAMAEEKNSGCIRGGQASHQQENLEKKLKRGKTRKWV